MATPHGCGPDLRGSQRNSTPAGDMPTSATVERTFKSFAGGLEAAGLRRQTPREVTWVKWPRERILQRIADWHDLFGKLPAPEDWTHSRSRPQEHSVIRQRERFGEHPTAQTVRNAFGS